MYEVFSKKNIFIYYYLYNNILRYTTRPFQLNTCSIIKEVFYKQRFSMVREVFHMQRFYHDQRSFLQANIFPWSVEFFTSQKREKYFSDFEELGNLKKIHKMRVTNF